MPLLRQVLVVFRLGSPSGSLTCPWDAPSAGYFVGRVSGQFGVRHCRLDLSGGRCSVCGVRRSGRAIVVSAGRAVGGNLGQLGGTVAEEAGRVVDDVDVVEDAPVPQP